MPFDPRAVSAARTRDLRRAVLRPHQTVADLAAEERPRTHFVAVEDRGEVLATGWVRPEGPPGSWRVGGMAAAADHRGRGFGGRILSALVDHARAQGADRVWCHARLGAVSFYEAAGWRVETEVFEVPGIGPHVRMAASL